MLFPYSHYTFFSINNIDSGGTEQLDQSSVLCGLEQVAPCLQDSLPESQIELASRSQLDEAEYKQTHIFVLKRQKSEHIMLAVCQVF